jgi:hypothetical protein
MCMEQWGNRNTRRKARPLANWLTTNPKMTGPVSNLSLRHVRSTTIRLSGSPAKILYAFVILLMCVSCLRPSHHPSYDHTNSTGRRIQLKKLLIYSVFLHFRSSIQSGIIYAFLKVCSLRSTFHHATIINM